MVAGEGDGDEWPYAEQAVDGPGPLRDGTEADEGHLGRVDDAQHALDALVAEVGDGAARRGQVGAAEPPRPGAGGELAHGRHHLAHREAVGVVDGGHEEAAAAQREDETEVDDRRRPEGTVDPVAVEVWDGAGGAGRGQQQQGRRHEALLDGQLAVALPQPLEGRVEVHRGAQVVVRDLPVGGGHERGDALPHGAGVRMPRRRRPRRRSGCWRWWWWGWRRGGGR